MKMATPVKSPALKKLRADEGADDSVEDEGMSNADAGNSSGLGDVTLEAFLMKKSSSQIALRYSQHNVPCHTSYKSKPAKAFPSTFLC